jgi:hypothetical protein
MSKPLERSCGRGIRSSTRKAAISDSGFGMKVGQGGKVLRCETGICGSAGPTFRNIRYTILSMASRLWVQFRRLRPKPASPGTSVAPQTRRKFGALGSDAKCQILTLRSGMGELHSVEGWLKSARYSGAILAPIGG